MERLAKISLYTMPIDIRRIAGPELTQPVVFTGEETFSKPLVIIEFNASDTFIPRPSFNFLFLNWEYEGQS